MLYSLFIYQSHSGLLIWDKSFEKQMDSQRVELFSSFFSAIQTFVKEGDLAESILKTAKEVHANIIVMGSHSRKWLENIVMGSVTEKVLNNTSIPLFIIPTKKQNS